MSTMSTETVVAPAARPRRAPLPPLMSLRDAAAERLRALYARGEQRKLLRIGVKTKGCSGLSYDLSWLDGPGPGDERPSPTRASPSWWTARPRCS